MGKDLKGKELGVGVSQRKDGWYIGRYTDRYGRRVQKLFVKLQEARKWVSDSQEEDQYKNIDIPTNMNVDAWFDYWIDVKKRTVRPNTVRNYRDRYMRNIQPVIGKKLLVDINAMHCQIIMNKMGDEGYSTSTIYQARITLYNLLDYAYQNDIIRKNPCNKLVKSNVGVEVKERKALSLFEQREFCNAIEDCTYEIQYKFLLQTGLRTGELVGLKWSDIDFENRTLTISRSLEYRHSTKEWRVGPPKSKSGYRTIPLTEEAIKLLKLQKAKNDKIKVIEIQWAEYVFLCRKGTPIKNTTYDTMLYKMCDKAGIKHFSMHILRHTFATRCIDAGMKPKTLQMILGHSNISITMNKYVHPSDDQKLKEIDLIAESLNVV